MDQHLTSLTRRYADGELPAEEAAAVEERLEEDPEARRLADFERSLRERVGAVMGDDAPSGLGDAIADAMRSARGTAPASPRSPRRVSFLATAATLALVAGAVLVGIFGRPIDRVADFHNDQDFVFDAAVHASTEHYNCIADNNHRMTKAPTTDLDEAIARLSGHLRIEIPRIDLTAVDFRFDCAGPCQVPGSDRSAHFMYVRESGSSPAMLSIYVVPDLGQFEGDVEGGLRLGEWYFSDGGSQCKHDVLRSTDGQLVYFIACCDADSLEPITAAVNEAINVR